MSRQLIDTEIIKLMSQGDQHLKSQNFSDAKKCYQEVIQKKPDESEAFYFLGWIAHNENQPGSADEYLKKALYIQPLNKNYLLGLTNLYAQTNQHQAAIKLFQQFLESDSTHADVFHHYAHALTRAKEHTLAIDALQKSIKLNPNELTPYMNLGEMLYHLMQFREAQQVYRSALNNGLKSEGLYLNLAKLHIDHGELEQAKVTLADAIVAYPDSLVFSYRLNSMDSRCLTPELYERLTGQDHKAITPDNQFYRYWLLSNYANKNGDPISEMDFLVKAHGIHAQMSKFHHDSDFYLKHLATLTLPSTNNLEQQRSAESKEISPIFIIGVPRCGSTLIENIICSGPEQVLKGEEPGAISHAVTNNIQDDSQTFWLKFQNQAKDNFHKCKLLNDNLRFTDKSLENIFLVDFIISLYPKAKVIYCDRAPLASIVSIMKNNMVLLPWAHHLDKIFQYVDNSLNAIERWTKQYPERIYKIRYEQLVTNPEEESKKLMAFCNLPWDKSCLSFHQNEGLVSRTASHVQIRQKINQNSLYSYQAYKPFFEPYEEKYPWLAR